MKVVFIYNGTESLGIEYISSLLKSKGHEVTLVFDPAIFSGDVFINNKRLAKYYNIDSYIIKRAIALNPDLIAFSAYTGNYRWCLGLARAIRQISKIPIVFGGVHPTAVPERVLSNRFVDFVILGEGEFAMLDLLEHLSDGEPLLYIPNICFKSEGVIKINKPRPYIEDLDSLPFPDKQLFFDEEPFFKNNRYLITSSRGCPYNCTYCSNCMYQALYRGSRKHVRRRSPDNVIEELLQAKEKWQMKQVFFADDVFTLSRPWLEEFIEKYRLEINVPFFCNVHPATLTKETAALLKKGGCFLVEMGVQSGSERVRREDYGRLESNRRIAESAAHLKANKISVQVDHIFGAPSECREDLEKSLQLYRDIKPEIILTFWLTYYPKTKIVDLAKNRGVLTEEAIRRIEEGHIGYTHDSGSVDKKMAPLFTNYEFVFELMSCFRINRLAPLLLKVAPFIPFKKTVGLLLYTVTGLRYNKQYILNKLLYAVLKTSTWGTGNRPAGKVHFRKHPDQGNHYRHPH